MRIADEVLPQKSPIFVSHDERDFKVVADSAGLEVLVLQYPGGERVAGRKSRPASEQGPGARSPKAA